MSDLLHDVEAWTHETRAMLKDEEGRGRYFHTIQAHKQRAEKAEQQRLAEQWERDRDAAMLPPIVTDEPIKWTRLEQLAYQTVLGLLFGISGLVVVGLIWLLLVVWLGGAPAR